MNTISNFFYGDLFFVFFLFFFFVSALTGFSKKYFPLWKPGRNLSGCVYPPAGQPYLLAAYTIVLYGHWAGPYHLCLHWERHWLSPSWIQLWTGFALQLRNSSSFCLCNSTWTGFALCSVYTTLFDWIWPDVRALITFGQRCAWVWLGPQVFLQLPP